MAEESERPTQGEQETVLRFWDVMRRALREDVDLSQQRELFGHVMAEGDVRNELRDLKQRIPPKWVSVLILPVVAIIGGLLIAMMAYQQASLSGSISSLREGISGMRTEMRDGLSSLRPDVNGIRTEIQGLRGDMQPFLRSVEQNQEAIQASQRAIEDLMRQRQR